jgi:hypothetical protein
VLAKEFKGGKPALENQNPLIGGRFQHILLENGRQ